jgi:hypothetical protein
MSTYLSDVSFVSLINRSDTTYLLKLINTYLKKLMTKYHQIAQRMQDDIGDSLNEEVNQPDQESYGNSEYSINPVFEDRLML